MEVDEEYRNRVIPTLGRMREAAQSAPGRKHIALGKLVYVIPEQRFARIIGVQECGTRFRVERRKEKEKASTQAADANDIADLSPSLGELNDGEIQGASNTETAKTDEVFAHLNIKWPEDVGQVWEARHLLAT